jgi:hypothetical protein
MQRRLGQLSPSDSIYPAALFAAGLVADTDARALDFFRQLSIEYSRSDWADEALLRMAELAYASGELSAAARFSERILLDYPFSDKLSKAAYWAGRSRMEMGETERGCEHLNRAAADAANDIELSNRARYYMQRCAASEAASDSAAEARPTTGRTVFSVQVAAVQSAAAADELMQSLHQAGYDAHVVRDADGLLKVRVGRFSNRAEAQQIVGRVRGVVGGNPFVVEESR